MMLKLNKKGECPLWKVISIVVIVLLVLVVLSVMVIDKYDLKERLANISVSYNHNHGVTKGEMIMLSAIEENGENIVLLNENLMQIAKSLDVLQKQHIELNDNLHIINDKIKIIGGRQNE